MAGPARLITVNLGSQTVGIAEFRVVRGGLVLVNYRLHEVPLDPETGHRRDAHVAFEEAAAVLREMMQEMQIPRRPVNYALPAQSVFARFVKLPPLVQEKLHQIVSFEAQQNVPFPLDEVVWDYQLVGGGLGEQIQVVLVAIKIDLLNQINEAVEGTGLETSIVDIAPMALYNAFRNSYPEVGDCSLLLDIGALTTNILFIESG
jgi:type IV pilus assembly protein PilM